MTNLLKGVVGWEGTVIREVAKWQLRVVDVVAQRRGNAFTPSAPVAPRRSWFRRPLPLLAGVALLAALVVAIRYFRYALTHESTM
jgi:hypothetical protein